MKKKNKVSERCSKCHAIRSWGNFHKSECGYEELNTLCKKCGAKSERNLIKIKNTRTMYDNKNCTQYLGVVIGERLCRHLFNNVKTMPYKNAGYDFICDKGKKIDIKTATIKLNYNKYPNWSFTIRKNKIADYFILVAFDNRKDLNPIHMWLIPGYEVNHLEGASITPSRIDKWQQWEKTIEEVQQCCNTLKEDGNKHE